HRVDVRVVRDVIAVVAQRRGIEGQEPDGVDSQVLQVRQLFDQAAEIASAVGVAVEERPDVELVDDRVLVPERVVLELEDVGQAAAGAGLGGGDHRKYSKSCSLRTRRRKRKICPGMLPGLSSTKLRGPFHR